MLLLWIICVAGALGTIVLVYTLYIAYLHWKYSHIPSPKRSSFYAGHLPDLWLTRKNLDKEASMALAIHHWTHGVSADTFVVFFYHMPIVYTLDPAIVKDIMMNPQNCRSPRFRNTLATVFNKRYMGNGLVTIKSHEEWKQRRRLYDPAFSTTYLKTLTSVFNEVIDSTINELKSLADGKTEINLKDYIWQTSMDIISKVAFGSDFTKQWTAGSLGVQVPLESQDSLLLYLIKKSTEGLQKGFTSFCPPLNPFLYPFEGKKYQQSVLALRKIGRDCIMKRINMIKSGEEIPQDILTYILSNNSETASIEETVDDFITFYVGGMETTASAVLFAIVLLCQHPNTLERLQQEVKDVLGEQETVTSKDLDELKYTEQVFFEALRLYPPAFGIPKVLHNPLVCKNYVIPAGTEIVAVSMDRMPRYYDDPDTFNPDRFHSDHKRPSSFVYFPFGVGQRACIGKHFAIMEGKILLARLFQTFTLSLPKGYELTPIERLTNQPKELVCTMSLN